MMIQTLNGVLIPETIAEAEFLYDGTNDISDLDNPDKTSAEAVARHLAEQKAKYGIRD